MTKNASNSSLSSQGNIPSSRSSSASTVPHHRERSSSYGPSTSRPQSMEHASSSLYIKRQPRTSHVPTQQNHIAALTPETPHTSGSLSSQRHFSHHADDSDLIPLMSSPSSARSSHHHHVTRSRPTVVSSTMHKRQPSAGGSVGGTLSHQHSSGSLTSAVSNTTGGASTAKFLRFDHNSSSDDSALQKSQDSIKSEEITDHTLSSNEDVPPLPNSPFSYSPKTSPKRKRKFMRSASSNSVPQESAPTDAQHGFSNTAPSSQHHFQHHHQNSSPPSSAYTSPKIPTYSIPTPSTNMPSYPSSPKSILKRKDPPVIKNYVKGDLLGQGANGRVHLSFNSDSGEFFAIKEVTFSNLSPDVLEERLQALQREISVMKTLDHENIVRYYGASKQGKTLNIFLEYIPGGSLAALVKRYGRLSEEVCRKFTKQILLGLDYLHKNRIVHRDIKGANILINVEGIAKLADFGASRQIADILTMTQDFQTLSGTPHFMAPEIIMQTGHGRSADIWSVGCTVMEMCTGKPPFAEYRTAAAVMFHIASTNDLPKFPEFMSEDARSFLKRCFVRDRTKRATAEELLRHPWLRSVVTPLEQKMTNISHPMDGPSINNLLIEIQAEERAQAAQGQISARTDTTPPNSTRFTLRRKPSDMLSSPSNVKPSLHQSSPLHASNGAHVGNADEPPLPKVTVADSVDFNPMGILEKDEHYSSSNSLTLSQDDLTTAKEEPETEVEYDSPRMGYDDQSEINRFLRKKSDIQNQSMKSMDFSLSSTPPLSGRGERVSSREMSLDDSSRPTRRLSSRRRAKSNVPPSNLSVETGQDDDEDFPVHNASPHPMTVSPPRYATQQHPDASPESPHSFSSHRATSNPDERTIETSYAQKQKTTLQQVENEKRKKAEEQQRRFEEEQRKYKAEVEKVEKTTQEMRTRPSSGSSSGRSSSSRRAPSATRRSPRTKPRSNSTNSNKSSGRRPRPETAERRPSREKGSTTPLTPHRRGARIGSAKNKKSLTPGSASSSEQKVSPRTTGGRTRSRSRSRRSSPSV
eukprot:CAMPEP_0117452496 /NCGR_PEP_ID=MMETSP0759-20121206/9652_1 /TAXON_ID=63605 /ORGANISM="Percolomonas cosmopolitus, Strain WS" /LENGTH=1032 /DNA_ID=CAMNT_0005245327 /DNA_START=583 /DNA_END=3681 /DNA_ORIENTATION=-